MEKATDTILDYARTCFSSFDELPFNVLDAAICTQMAYLFLEENFANSYSDEGMPVWQLLRAELFREMCNALPSSEELIDLIFAFAASPRYRQARIKYYRNELDPSISLQFSGVVYSFSDTLHFIGFRGTDKSMVGWKEDVLLTAKKAAYCQMMAVNYLNGVGAKLNGALFVGGHSKGGNLASYAAAHCSDPIRDQISHVYNMDGPGFPSSELGMPGMIKIRDRVTKIIASPVGMLMQSETEPILIRTKTIGPMQHFAFNWVTEGYGFAESKDTAKRSMKVINNINAWVETVSDEEVSLFAETFFGVLEAANITYYDELLSNPALALSGIKKTFHDTDPAKRKEMLRVLLEALTGRKRSQTSAEHDEDDFDIDWNRIERVMNDFETEQFGKEYNLFL